MWRLVHSSRTRPWFSGKTTLKLSVKTKNIPVLVLSFFHTGVQEQIFLTLADLEGNYTAGEVGHNQSIPTYCGQKSLL